MASASRGFPNIVHDVSLGAQNQGCKNLSIWPELPGESSTLGQNEFGEGPVISCKDGIQLLIQSNYDTVQEGENWSP